MNTLTKSIVNVSILAAALAELYLGTAARGPLWTASLAALVVAGVAGIRFRGPAVSVVISAIYLAPAGFLLWFGEERTTMEALWLVPLVALLVTGPAAWRWSIPSPWRLPLVAWALIAAITWPIVALRETSFSWVVMYARGASTTGIGISPYEAVQQTITVALSHAVGLLWIDALFRWYADRDRRRFRQQILVPLAVTAIVASAVGLYQGFVDFSFLSGHLWPHMRRAAGTLMDGNAFGTIEALWAPAFVALSLEMGGARWLPLAIITFLFAGLGVVMSGSRTALAAMGIGAAAVLRERWLHARADHTNAGAAGKQRLKLAAVLIVLVGLVVLVARLASTTSIVERGTLALIPGLGDRSVLNSLSYLWDRFGYGTAAMRMIADHPLAGVGIGAFHTLIADYGYLVTGAHIAPDNAQNWYRHLFAELGLLGSLPWMAWTVLFAKALFTKADAGADVVTTDLMRGPLVAMGLISILGVPGQALPVILTFWTFAFWFLIARQTPGPQINTPQINTPQITTPQMNADTSLQWALVLLLVCVHAGLTLVSARGDLLPQNRAQRFGWIYEYGISDLERIPNTFSRRWTDEQSLSTIPVRGRTLKFVAWAEHPDANEHPVHLRVVADGKLAFDGQLKRSSAIELHIPARPGARVMVLETTIDRLFRPSDYGSRDTRHLGLSILDWEWEP